MTFEAGVGLADPRRQRRLRPRPPRGAAALPAAGRRDGGPASGGAVPGGLRGGPGGVNTGPKDRCGVRGGACCGGGGAVRFGGGAGSARNGAGGRDGALRL